MSSLSGSGMAGSASADHAMQCDTTVAHSPAPATVSPTTATNLIIPVVADSRVLGWPKQSTNEGIPDGTGYDSLTSLLSLPFESDVHYLTYTHPTPLRFNTRIFDLVPGFTVWMVVQSFDIDCPLCHKSQGAAVCDVAPDTWWYDERAKVDLFLQCHRDAFVSRTKRGYHIVLIRKSPFRIDGTDSIKAWMYDYCRACCYLARAFRIVADPSCSTWNRLHRAPHATRDPIAGPEMRETIGDPAHVGLWDYEPSDESLEADLDIASTLAGKDKIWSGKLNSTLRPKPSTQQRTRHKASPRISPTLDPPPGSPDDLVDRLLPSVAGYDDGRHELYLCLSGALAGRGVSPARVVEVVRRLATLAGDPKVDGRVHDAETTIEMHQRGEPYKGYGALARDWPDIAAAMDDALGEEMSEGFQALKAEFESTPIPVLVAASTASAGIATALHRAQQQPDAIEVIKVTPGAGKTRAAMDAAIKRADRTLMVFPTNSLALENYERAKLARPNSVARRFGVLSLVLPDGTPACQHHEAAARLQALGLSVPRMFCARCDARDNCTAIAGAGRRPQDSLIVANHSLIGSGLEQIGQSGLVIVDESPRLFEHVSLDVEELELALHELRRGTFYRKYAAAVAPFVFLAHQALVFRLAGEDFLAALQRKAWDLRDDLEFFRLLVGAYVQFDSRVTHDTEPMAEALNLFRAASGDVGRGVDPPLSDRAAKAMRAAPATAGNTARAARAIKALARLTSENTNTFGVRWNEDRPHGWAPLPTDEEEHRLLEHKISKMTLTFVNQNLAAALRRQGPTVILDGTPDTETLRILAQGRAVNETALEVQDGSPVERVVRYWSKGTRKALLPHGKPDWSAVGPGLAQVLEQVMLRNAKVLLLITYKAIERAIRELAESGRPIPHPRAEALLLSLRAAGGMVVLGHFGGIRGHNSFDGVPWQKLDAVATLADPLLNIAEADCEAEALGLDEAQAVRRYRALAADELAQAHGRLRAPLRSRPGFCFHLGRIVPGGWNRENATLEVSSPGRPAAVSAMGTDELERLILMHGSARALADASGCSQAAISAWRHGRPISADVASKLRGAPS